MPRNILRLLIRLGVVALSFLAAVAVAHAEDTVWRPAEGHRQIQLWSGTPPDDKLMPGSERIRPGNGELVVGKTVTNVTNVSNPTITVYAPKDNKTGAAVLVIPGGGFEILAIDYEGTEVCDWLVAEGITCVLEKYRVPSEPYDWKTNDRPHNLQIPTRSLEDTQRAMRLIRSHAQEWHIDPHKIGVLGFSAGGYLVAQISTNYSKKLYKPIDDADKLSARPDFAVAVYPGHIATERDSLNPNVPVTKQTPPTFIVQAEDDHVDGVHQALVYFTALKNAEVPAELHIYATGGHAFGLRPTELPITHWPHLVDEWLKTIGMVPK
jgi:acetyl esterase/lipase